MVRRPRAAFLLGGTLLFAIGEARCARILGIGDLGVAPDSAVMIDAGALTDVLVPLPYMLGYVVGNNSGVPGTVESWLGRPLDLVGNSMTTTGYLESATYQTSNGDPTLLEVNFPMLSIYGESPSLDDMALAAGGGYDDAYTNMAKALAARTNPLLAVRIGAQFNGGRYPWGNGVGKNATYANYVAAFLRIADILRTYNPHVLVEWCVAWGGSDPTPYWPGKFDGKVNAGGADVVSMVLYQADLDSGAWAAAQEGGTVNVDWMVTYAQQHGVKIALSEYAAGTMASGGIMTGRGRDDGTWTADSIAWMNAQPAGFFLWEMWSGYPGADDLVTDGANPAERAAWKAAWSKTTFGGTWWDGAAPGSVAR